MFSIKTFHKKNNNKITKSKTKISSSTKLLNELKKKKKSSSNTNKKTKQLNQLELSLIDSLQKMISVLEDKVFMNIYLTSNNEKEFIKNIKNYLKLYKSDFKKGDEKRIAKLYHFLNKRMIEILKSNLIKIEKKESNHKRSKKKKLKIQKDSLTYFKYRESKKGGGGPYLQRLASKGNQPITGNDFKMAMDEMMLLINDIRNLSDAREIAYGPSVLINYFNGNEEEMINYVKYNYLNKIINLNTFPPQINISYLLNNIGLLLNIYQKDKQIKTNYYRQKGLPLPKEFLGISDKYEKLAGLSTKISRAKSMLSNPNPLSSMRMKKSLSSMI